MKAIVIILAFIEVIRCFFIFIGLLRMVALNLLSLRRLCIWVPVT